MYLVKASVLCFHVCLKLNSLYSLKTLHILSKLCVFVCLCFCVMRREIQRLQDEREELLRSLRVSQSCFNRWTDASVVHDLTAMLACRDRIDEELEAEKDKVTSLKDQVKCVFPRNVYRIQYSEFLLIATVDPVCWLRFQILKWERKLAGQRTGGRITRRCMKSDNSNLLKSTHLIENKLYRVSTTQRILITISSTFSADLHTYSFGMFPF